MNVPRPAPPGILPLYARVPVNLFGAVLGLGGLALAWRGLADGAILGAFASAVSWAAEVAALAAALVFVVLALAYGAKAMRHWPRVAAEFRNPAVHGFFAAISMALLVLALCALPHHLGLARALWTTGAVMQLGLGLALAAFWFKERPPLAALAPGLFLPSVGGMLATFGGVPLGETTTAWVFFALGLVSGLPLAALIVCRLAQHPPLPPPLRPSLAIFLAPPALGYLAWQQLSAGDGGALAYVFFVALMAALAYLAALLPDLARLPFGPGWWAYTFPLAVATNAALAHARADGTSWWLAFALALAAIMTIVILGVLIRSLMALARGTLLPPG